MSKNRRTTVRDLPAICLIFGMILAVGAIGLPIAAQLDIAKADELTLVSGTLRQIQHNAAKGQVSPKLSIYIQGPDGTHHLWQNDLSGDNPNISSLKEGDQLSALVKPDWMGRDIEWLWELRRDGQAIFTYDDALRFMNRLAERDRGFTNWLGVGSILMFALALMMKNHFGSWSQPDTPDDSLK